MQTTHAIRRLRRVVCVDGVDKYLREKEFM